MRYLLKITGLIVGILLIAAIIAFLLNLIGEIGLSNAVSISILLVTAVVIGIQAYANKKLAEYQIMPAVDVNMIYDKGVGKTYFWFLNSSNIPAIVEWKLKWSKHGKKFSGDKRRFYIAPKVQMATSTVYDDWQTSPPHGINVTLIAVIKPAYEDTRAKFKLVKSYRFHDKEFRWDEDTWGFPDRPFPGLS